MGKINKYLSNKYLSSPCIGECEDHTVDTVYYYSQWVESLNACPELEWGFWQFNDIYALFRISELVKVLGIEKSLKYGTLGQFFSSLLRETAGC